MTDYNDTYKTIEIASEEVAYKDKKSKFFGYAFPVSTEMEVKNHIDTLKKQHPSGRHWCYAYQMGTETLSYRANDYGEPNNSAGIPIYGQIQSFEITIVVVVVVRYFGGVKLGVGGLISAYKTTAQMALENVVIIEKTIDFNYCISFGYKNINKVMRIIKEKNIDISNQKMEMNCEITISIRKKNAKKIFDIFDSIFEVTIKKID